MYIARQPIFDRNISLYAYELLYRDSSKASVYRSNCPVASTATVVGGLLELDLVHLIESKLAFINVDERFLLHDSIELINPRLIVIELLESMTFTDIVKERIIHLREKGYRFALDDFNQSIHGLEILEWIDFIKYDIIATPLDTIKDSVYQAKKMNKKVLAEKVETYNEFLEAKSIGFDFFQGFFFSKPRIVGEVPKTSTNHRTYLQLIGEIHTAEPSIPKMAKIIEKDVKIAYRLLRLIGNKKLSSQSIVSAILHIGLEAMQKWLYLLLLQDSSMEKPDELLRLSLQRSRFAELISSKSKFMYRSSEVALMCLLSVIDAMMNTTIEQALRPLGVDDEIKQAMIDKTGPYACIYDLVCNYEILDNDKIVQYTRDIGVEYSMLTHYYIESFKFSEEICKRISNA